MAWRYFSAVGFCARAARAARAGSRGGGGEGGELSTGPLVSMAPGRHALQSYILDRRGAVESDACVGAGGGEGGGAVEGGRRAAASGGERR